eukprot:TRINITY_DN5428_c0_g2_i1.p1 TRINITY_DN5428_c0_g2~~TRINITY_DN5428_c0_g2_i1.p1  ORF type:complete len:272 (+),score=80.97 TRINITY_DN5428_c0_g2_i1:146-961(+)
MMRRTNNLRYLVPSVRVFARGFASPAVKQDAHASHSSTQPSQTGNITFPELNPVPQNLQQFGTMPNSEFFSKIKLPNRKLSKEEIENWYPFDGQKPQTASLEEALSYLREIPSLEKSASRLLELNSELQGLYLEKDKVKEKPTRSIETYRKYLGNEPIDNLLASAEAFKAKIKPLVNADQIANDVNDLVIKPLEKECVARKDEAVNMIQFLWPHLEEVRGEIARLETTTIADELNRNPGIKEEIQQEIDNEQWDAPDAAELAAKKDDEHHH